jgi:prepilin-type N-terminal cleavage/methylation domain-containing protein
MLKGPAYAGSFNIRGRSPQCSHPTKVRAVFENLCRIQRNRELNGERGFTLIELLIVIVVLGILAAIVVIALGGATGSSAVAACNSDAKTVSIAVSDYDAQKGSYPANIAALVPTYLKAAPSNPSYYTIGLSTDGKAVTVELNTNDPGEQTGAGAPLPANQAATAGSLYEADGSTAAFTYGATTAATTTGLQGAGICAGV